MVDQLRLLLVASSWASSNSLSASWKAVSGFRPVGKLKGDVLDVKSSNRCCKSISGLPVSLISVLPSAVVVTVGFGVLLAALLISVPVRLLHGEAGHSDSGLMGHVTDLPTCGPPETALTSTTLTSPAARTTKRSLAHQQSMQVSMLQMQSLAEHPVA